MAWYSYFLMSVPEVFIISLLSFVFFAIPVRRNIKKMLIEAALRGAVAFLASIFIDNSFKIFFTITFGVIIITTIYHFKWKYSLLICLFSVVGVMIAETITVFYIIPLLSWNVQDVLADPLLRIAFSYIMMSILLIVTLILYKFKIRWNIGNKVLK